MKQKQNNLNQINTMKNIQNQLEKITNKVMEIDKSN